MNNRTPQLPRKQATTQNSASAGATVGMQANEINNSTVYQVLADDPPEKKYRVGLQYLNDGVPLKATEWIGAAIAEGLNDAKVRYHWALAMLSKRSYRDLSRPERDSLDVIAYDLNRYPESDYKSALEAIWQLLCHHKRPGGDPKTAEKTILALPASLRAEIDRHLSELLSGATKDQLWAQRKELAVKARFGQDRMNRVWAYFHPEPIKPRVRPTLPPQVFPIDLIGAIGSAAANTLAVTYLAWLALSSAVLTPILGFPLAAVAVFFGLRDAFEWRYRRNRIKGENYRLHIYSSNGRNSGEGFATQVTNSFKKYFYKYRPEEVDAKVWMTGTRSIRGFLRDEICEIYRESAVGIGELNWLIGYLAREVRQQWRDGSLYDYQTKYRVDPLTKARCLLALALVPAATAPFIADAMQTDMLRAWAALIVVATVSPIAVRRWWHIWSERRRARDEQAEAEDQYEDRLKAYRRWKQRLDETRPSETDMETWLYCDMTMLIDAALLHYRLAWRDVIARAVFQGPNPYRKRHRDPAGPWRYSSYDLMLFLITDDGVREVSSTLDFERAAFNGQERNNFRFDAVSSVEVSEGPGGSRTLRLTLTNGPTRELYVTEAENAEQYGAGGADDLLDINLSAAGFVQALRILEGIAAEGKEWIDRDKSRDKDAANASD